MRGRTFLSEWRASTSQHLTLSVPHFSVRLLTPLPPFVPILLPSAPQVKQGNSFTPLNGSADPAWVEDYSSGTDRWKGPIPEPLRAFKNVSLTEPACCPSSRICGNWRQTLWLARCCMRHRISQITQSLNFGDLTAHPLPPGLFTSDSSPKATWGSNVDSITGYLWSHEQ